MEPFVKGCWLWVRTCEIAVSFSRFGVLRVLATASILHGQTCISDTAFLCLRAFYLAQFSLNNCVACVRVQVLTLCTCKILRPVRHYNCLCAMFLGYLARHELVCSVRWSSRMLGCFSSSAETKQLTF